MAVAWESLSIGETFELENVTYRRVPHGLVLDSARDSKARTYRALEGTVGVAAHAFLYNDYLEMMALPKGCRWIGDHAFAACENLISIGIPDTMESIGDWAFFGSSIESIRIPAGCVHIGECALIANGSERAELFTGIPATSLYEIFIDPANTLFYFESGVFCARGTAPDGGDEVQVYIGPDTSVQIPENVSHIGELAFGNNSSVEELIIPARVKTLGSAALFFDEAPRHVVLQLDPPIDGHTQLDFYPPHNNSGLHAVNRSFALDHIDPAHITAQFDDAIFSIADTFASCSAMLERMHDPVLLSDEIRDEYIAFLRKRITKVCQAFRSHHYNEGFELMVETGVLDEETITRLIDSVHEDGDTTLVAYLLQLKHEHFGDSLGFSLEI